MITQAIVYRPPQSRAIVLAGRDAVQSRANEVMLNESAAQALHAHVGSVLEMRGYRPSELQQVMNGAKVPPKVSLGSVVVTGIIRLPTDLTDNLDRGCRRDLRGPGRRHRDGRLLPEVRGLRRQLPGHVVPAQAGAAGLPAFEAQVRRLAGNNAQIELGDDNATSGAFAQRGTTLEALALLVFAIIVALALLVVVGQSLARQTYAAAGDFPALRSLGATPRQLAAVALAPGALVAVAGMALAVPAAYLLSWFTPIGLARRAEISPGFEFDAVALLGGAAVLALLLAGRAALAAPRAARTGARAAAADRPGAGLAGGGWRAGGCPRPRCRGSGWRSSPAAAGRPSRSARRSSGWRRRWPRCWRRWCSGPACRT